MYDMEGKDIGSFELVVDAGAAGCISLLNFDARDVMAMVHVSKVARAGVYMGMMGSSEETAVSSMTALIRASLKGREVKGSPAFRHVIISSSLYC